MTGGERAQTGARSHQHDEPRGINFGLLAELDVHHLSVEVDGLNPEPVGQHTDTAIIHKLKDRCRRLAIPILDFGQSLLQLAFASRSRDSAVDDEPLIHVRDVRVVNAQIHP